MWFYLATFIFLSVNFVIISLNYWKFRNFSYVVLQYCKKCNWIYRYVAKKKYILAFVALFLCSICWNCNKISLFCYFDRTAIIREGQISKFIVQALLKVLPYYCLFLMNSLSIVFHFFWKKLIPSVLRTKLTFHFLFLQIWNIKIK